MPRPLAKRFTAGTAAQAWLEETFETWIESLSPAERKALRFYKGDGYREINQVLRYGGESDPDILQAIEDLDVALSRFQLPEPVIAYRGLGSQALFTQAEDLIGDTIEEPAYLSTSLLRSVAEGYLSARSEWRVLEEILVPGGVAVGAYVGAPDLVEPMEEHEFLLPRGTELAVHAVRREADHVRLEVEVTI